MFEVGFSEIAVIAVIALIVLGPERLPKAARMAGTFLRKARRSFDSLKLEVERELEADELKKQFAQIAAAPAALSNALQQPLAEAKAALDHNVDAVMQAVKAPTKDLPTPDDLPIVSALPLTPELQSNLDAKMHSPPANQSAPVPASGPNSVL